MSSSKSTQPTDRDVADGPLIDNRRRFVSPRLVLRRLAPSRKVGSDDGRFQRQGGAAFNVRFLALVGGLMLLYSTILLAISSAGVHFSSEEWRALVSVVIVASIITARAETG